MDSTLQIFVLIPVLMELSEIMIPESAWINAYLKILNLLGKTIIIISAFNYVLLTILLTIGPFRARQAAQQAFLLTIQQEDA